MLFSLLFFFFFFNDTATTEIYTLSLHDALPICYRVRKYVGAYLAASGGADALVFTGGIGENSAEVRARVCEGLAWMRSEEHTSELQSRQYLVCRLLLEKKKNEHHTY